MGLSCPVCKTKELTPFPVGKNTVEKCPSCHGLWFDCEELGDVEKLPETELMNDFQDQLDNSTPSQTESGVKDRLCPECGKAMNSYQYDVSSGIWIQGCPDGEGIWLDKGEIVKVHKHLQNAMQELPPEKMKALTAQLSQIQREEKVKEDQAIDSLYGHHEGSGVTLPVWHAMDGVCRFVDHVLSHIEDKIGELEERL